MATSGSTDWNLQRDDILQEAFELIGIFTLSSADKTRGARTLNSIAKGKARKGVRLWSVDETVKTFSAPSIVSNNGTNYKCQLPHTSSASDEPGVGDNSSMYWVETSDDADGAWALSTSYSTPKAFDLASNIMGIDKAFYRDSSGSDHPIDIITMDEYWKISDKDAEGTISYLALEKKLSARRVHLYKVVSTYTDVLHYAAVTKLEDWDSSTDDPDFPVSWIPFLTRETAYWLSFKYDIDISTRDRLKAGADEALREAKSDDFEEDDEDFIEGAY